MSEGRYRRRTTVYCRVHGLVLGDAQPLTGAGRFAYVLFRNEVVMFGECYLAYTMVT